MAVIKPTYKVNVIYVYEIDDKAHKGAVKIGKTELECDLTVIPTLTPNCARLRTSAEKRIKHQTQTAGIKYNLLWAEKALFVASDGKSREYIDKDIHNVLINSGYHRHSFPELGDNQPDEWFDLDLTTVRKAIEAIKQGRRSIEGVINQSVPEIHFREEQEDAIDRTQKYFKSKAHDKMLWNAKMRFGKTLCALELIRRCDYKHTLILTHRPAVKNGWFEDYQNIKYENYDYGSKPSADQRNGQKLVGETFEYLKKSGKNFIYFASMQDLRGSWKKDGSLKKNEDVFNTSWDLVIIDEAHEGTQTQLGQQVIKSLAANKSKPHFLYLSGTPYNILDQFSKEEIYTWDYVMEQDAKESWPLKHPGEPNPYEGLAHLNILTYNLGNVFEKYNHSEEDYFDFSEFFRLWTGDELTDGMVMPQGAQIDDFVHKTDVLNFLNLLCKEDSKSNYPFSTEKYRNCFVHTFWLLPRSGGVKIALALSKMLKEHPFFKKFKIINVAGEGDRMTDEENSAEMYQAERDCVQKVMNGIKNNPQGTITLSCGRMTTGVSIEEWTGVFMLSGGYNVNAAPYMQTVFRSQTPIKHHDYIKKECYAIDFAPDRTLTVINDYIKNLQRKTDVEGKGKKRHIHTTIETFTRFCSVIGIEGSKTIDYDAKRFIQRVNHVYADHVIRSGGKDHHMYSDYRDLAAKDIESIAAIAQAIKGNGKGNKSKGGKTIVVTNEGMTPENSGSDATTSTETTSSENQGARSRKPKDPEQEKRKLVYDTLDQITIRLPMLIFGAIDDIKTISFEKFIADIDEDSWTEFMPKGLTKELFMTISHIYNNDMFVAMASEIINRTRHADALPVTERIQELAEIISQFHFPDNETVLTPWNVVNMQMSDTLGGWDFFDERHEKGHQLQKPRLVDRGKVTKQVFEDRDTKILELNSKSGVYPLYLAYSVFKGQDKVETMSLPEEEERRVWQHVVENNIYVVCKTPMAEKITRRVLAGYDDSVKLNTAYIEDLIPKMRDKKQQEQLIEELTLPKTYENRQKKKPMKFNAIVSNPPYQIKDGGAGASATPVYNLFVDSARRLQPEYISIIMPAKWYNDGKGLAKFREGMFRDRHIASLFDFVDEHACFPGVDVAGGVCYFLWDKSHDGDCEYTSVVNGKRKTMERDLTESAEGGFIRFAEAEEILDKVKAKSSKYYDTRVSIQRPFGLRTYVTPLPSGDITLKYSGGKGPYESKLITTGKEMIDKWKVTISYLTAEHAGQTDSNGQKKIISSLDILRPGEICTETYLVVDAFNTETEANALRKYLCTRLVRFLVSLLAATQHLSKDKFRFVPVQDFTPSSEIPWDKSVDDIDDKLYDIYGITGDEQNFIQKLIKPMK